VRPGELFAGRFRIDRQLGQGGMGAVYAATNLSLGRPVALKVLLTHVALREDSLRRFLREARASAAIRHPNVIEILDVIQDEGGVPAIVMELLTGRSLAEHIHGRRVPLDEIASLLVPVCSGVGTAHARGIVHRDLKPENIFLANEAGKIEPKVLDFGIAKLTEPLDLGETDAATRTGAVLGTPHYMAPEQAFGERGVDHRADIWSLGVILYEALAGARPFTGENAGQIMRLLANPSPIPIERRRPDLPREIVDLVSSMMEPDRKTRIGDLTEVSAILARFTDVRAPEFSRAATVAAISSQATLSSDDMHRVSNEPTEIAPLDSSAGSKPTLATQTDPMTAAPPITSAALSADAPPMPAPRRRPIGVIAAALVLAVGVASFIALRRPEPEKQPEPAAPPRETPVIEKHDVPKAIVPPPSIELPPTPSASASVKPKAVTNKTAAPAVSAKTTASQPTASAPGKGGLIETVPF
jgi:eukaryotic-like serine/threonine-protein kinase